MTTLATEYFKRHNKPCISPANDGLCFFTGENKNFICHTSSLPRNFIFCNDCLNGNMIILEIFMFNSESFSLIGHHHISPDTNLSIWMKERHQCEPVLCQNGQDVEKYLWKFFTAANRLTNLKSWQKWSRKKEHSVYTEMAKCVGPTWRKHFQNFYMAYVRLTAGRNYLYM